MSDPELKPCPFCGSPAESFSAWDGENADTTKAPDFYGVACTFCPAEVYMLGGIDIFKSATEAATAWNTRAGQLPQVSEVDLTFTQAAHKKAADANAKAVANAFCSPTPQYTIADELAGLLDTAIHALRSYERHNSSPDLAKHCADMCETALAKFKGGDR